MVVAIQMDVTNAYLNSHIKMGHQAYEAMNQSPGQSPMVSYQPTKSFQHFQNYRFFCGFCNCFISRNDSYNSTITEKIERQTNRQHLQTTVSEPKTK